MKYSVRICVGLALVWAAVPTVSWASKTSDGVTLLKQPTTFPIVISAPGSYRLKTNLTVPNANTTAILVQADNVTIDLNGFAILGPTVCSGGPPVTGCTPFGTGKGIDSGTHKNTTVVNGTVQGMGNTGVKLSPPARVQGVTALSNGADGIDAAGGTVTGCEADSNGYDGINAGMVVNSIAKGNNNDGIDASTVTGCEADQNGGNGVGDAVTVTSSTTSSNAGRGIGCSFCSAVAVVANSAASGNSQAGISAITVSSSTARNNGGAGINATMVSNSEAYGNGGTGIANAQLVSSCESDSNTGGDGIDSVTVVNSTTHNNSGRGIMATLVTSSEADHNSSDGIAAETMIGNDANNNTRDGLWGGDFSHAGYEDNVVNGNGFSPGAGGATSLGESLCNGVACP